MERHSNRCEQCSDFAPEGEDLCGGCSGEGVDERRQVKEENGERELRLLHGYPHSFEEIVEKWGVDLERWQVNRWNRWEQKPNRWLHQLRLYPRQTLIDARAIHDDLIEDLQDYAPTYDPIDHDFEDGVYAQEINVTDQHVGMLVYALETMSAHWDTEISTKMFLAAIMDQVEQSDAHPGEVEEYVLVIGNDMAHYDQLAGDMSGGATTAGTVQDVDTRRKRLMRALRDMIVSAVEYLRQRARVKVVVVPGNHDEDTAFTLGMIVEEHFQNDPVVEVDNSDPLRKVHQYGDVGIMFTHGQHEANKRLPMLFATEWPDVWGDTTFREIHLGHTHAVDQRGFELEATEDVEVRLRVFPSLAPEDAFHAKKGFHHVRSAESILWHRDYGFRALFNSTPRSLEDFVQ